MNIACPSWRMLLAHFTRLACSRARLSGGSSTITSSRISSSTPPTVISVTPHPLFAAGGCGAGAGVGAGAGADRRAGISTGVRLSALKGFAQLLHDSVRPRYRSFCIGVIGYGWPQLGQGT
jgi:hypothetical protein